MAQSKRKITDKPSPKESPADSLESKITNPLVFISHDTRDASLAEEFSNLLNNASAGALKSFRSSDTKGTQGIEYGLEWYPAIMDKIDEASDVVCLLTQRSIDRPWILYEAGVAKGKLGKNVIGIAMGIQHSVAFTGPFAQFQNNDGSIDAITKLVLDLVRKVPGLDPPQLHVEQLVVGFHKKSLEILAQTQKTPKTNAQEANDNIVAKLFEEVKIMFERLPSRIENRIDPDFKRKRKKLHPTMLEELMHLSAEIKNPSIAFLMLISVYKDDLPWVYEMGLETYRSLKAFKTPNEKRKQLVNFAKILEMTGHPIIRDVYGKSNDNIFFYEDTRHVLYDFIDRFYKETPKGKS